LDRPPHLYPLVPSNVPISADEYWHRITPTLLPIPDQGLIYLTAHKKNPVLLRDFGGVESLASNLNSPTECSRRLLSLLATGTQPSDLGSAVCRALACNEEVSSWDRLSLRKSSVGTWGLKVLMINCGGGWSEGRFCVREEKRRKFVDAAHMLSDTGLSLVKEIC
jgi:hypothetical protein